MRPGTALAASPHGRRNGEAGSALPERSPLSGRGVRERSDGGGRSRPGPGGRRGKDVLCRDACGLAAAPGSAPAGGSFAAGFAAGGSRQRTRRRSPAAVPGTRGQGPLGPAAGAPAGSPVTSSTFGGKSDLILFVSGLKHPVKRAWRGAARVPGFGGAGGQDAHTALLCDEDLANSVPFWISLTMAKLIVLWKKKQWLACCRVAPANADTNTVARNVFFNVYISICTYIYTHCDSIMCL